MVIIMSLAVITGTGICGSISNKLPRLHMYMGRNRLKPNRSLNRNATAPIGRSVQSSELKPYANDAFCEGINPIMLHQATCQPPSDGKPGYEFCAGQHFTPNITWWEQSPAFFTYLSRCSYMLQNPHARPHQPPPHPFWLSPTPPERRAARGFAWPTDRGPHRSLWLAFVIAFFMAMDGAR